MSTVAQSIAVAGVPVTPAVLDTLLLAMLRVERTLARQMTSDEIDMLIMAVMRALADDFSAPPSAAVH